MSTSDILNFYSADCPGVIANLSRMLNHGKLAGTGKLVILPVDQGFEHGPLKSFDKNPCAYDPNYHFEFAIEAGCNAYAAPLGFIESGARDYAGEIPLILKVNNAESLYKSDDPIPAITSGIDHALRLGCVAIGFTIYPGSKHKKQMYEEIAKLSREAKKVGLAVVIWSYPRGEQLKGKETNLETIAYAAHIAAQLGANIIKVKPPTDTSNLSDAVGKVLEAAFNKKRIVIFSGGPAKDTKELLDEVRLLAKGGSFGSIVGRNSFQREKSKAIDLLDKIISIYSDHS